MSAKARRRHEKGLEMAAAIVERTKSKVEKSKGRGRNIQQRSKNWDEINKAAEEAEGGEESDEEVKERGFDLDEDMDGANEETLTAPVADVNTAPAAVPLPTDDDGDEIL